MITKIVDGQRQTSEYYEFILDLEYQFKTMNDKQIASLYRFAITEGM